MKQITFDGKEYSAPDFVQWVGRDSDSTIRGYQYEPFQHNYSLSWQNSVGQDCVIYSPRCKMKLERV